MPKCVRYFWLLLVDPLRQMGQDMIGTRGQQPVAVSPRCQGEQGSRLESQNSKLVWDRMSI